MNHDTHQLPDGRSIRVLNDNILVQLDPPDVISRAGIILPTGVYENPYGVARILAYGYADATIRNDEGEIIEVRKVSLPGLSVGDGVYIVRFLDTQDSNVLLQKHYGGGLIRIKPKDIIFVFDYETERARFQTGAIQAVREVRANV
jgi:co-chaperonin GroES (HSP10)